MNRLSPLISGRNGRFSAVLSNGRIVLHRPQAGFLTANRRLDVDEFNRNRVRVNRALQSIENILSAPPPSALHR